MIKRRLPLQSPESGAVLSFYVIAIKQPAFSKMLEIYLKNHNLDIITSDIYFIRAQEIYKTNL